MGVKSEKLALTGSLTEILVEMLLLVEFHSAWAQCHWGEEWRIERWARSCLLGRSHAVRNKVYIINEKWGQESAGNGYVEKETMRMPQCKSKAGDVTMANGHHTIENGRGSRRPTSVTT